MIASIENIPQSAQLPAVKEKCNVLKEAVEDTQEHLNYSTDTDARVGHKAADGSFYGYKTHLSISDERIITAAVVTTGKKSDSHPGASARMAYFFYVKKCKVRPLREGCFKAGAKAKTYSVSFKSEEHLDQQAFQETEEFKRLARERYKIEVKNSELKNKHEYDQALNESSFGMQIQGATTIFAVNLKRILKLLNEIG